MLILVYSPIFYNKRISVLYLFRLKIKVNQMVNDLRSTQSNVEIETKSDDSILIHLTTLGKGTRNITFTKEELQTLLDFLGQYQSMQSENYYRGYDDGYYDGQETAR